MPVYHLYRRLGNGCSVERLQTNGPPTEMKEPFGINNQRLMNRTFKFDHQSSGEEKILSGKPKMHCDDYRHAAHYSQQGYFAQRKFHCRKNARS